MHEEEILKEFIEKISDAKYIDKDIAEAVNEHFWELL